MIVFVSFILLGKVYGYYTLFRSTISILVINWMSWDLNWIWLSLYKILKRSSSSSSFYFPFSIINFICGSGLSFNKILVLSKALILWVTSSYSYSCMNTYSATLAWKDNLEYGTTIKEAIPERTAQTPPIYPKTSKKL